ncbi:MAG UNVERIFIED_CONTAM: hypothetical protein LVR18_15165 [Planctomycetaceae bacterium]
MNSARLPHRVPGVFVSELFPRMAENMDKFVLVRSLSDSDGAAMRVSA